jgi:TldD protein
MTNTYMLGGDKDPKEIVASIKKGLYATNFGGGQVDITSGKFVFCCQRGLLGGKRQDPVSGQGCHHRWQRPGCRSSVSA